jgi:NAD(P)H-hydrate epimerase
MITREQARHLDERAMHHFRIPGIVLMENAGRNMAELLLSLGVSGLVTICCGKGNNGGDGLVLARHLEIAGVRVRVLLFADPAELSTDAAINHGICVKSGLDVRVVARDGSSYTNALVDAEWIVDALFGTGLQGAIRPPFEQIIAAINASPAKRFAVDIPSGMDANTGEPLGCCVRADHTATVVAPKVGFASPSAANLLGQLSIVGMGAPRRLLDELAL